jgi:putative ABC transport system ATP-binding protein
MIDVRNISKVYKSGEISLTALDNISVQIQEQAFVAIMGASGSGKSTFMNILGCLDRPTSGDYFFEDQHVNSLDKNSLAELRNKKMGFIFQSFNILPRTSALENVELPLLYDNSVGAKERTERALESLKSVGLADRANAMPGQLSGGQQQRVAIARALVNNPHVILADEPTGNLDSKTSYEIMEIFQGLNDAGSTIVMVTHEPDISSFALSNITFKDGKIMLNAATTQRKSAQTELKLLRAQKEQTSAI